MPARARHGLDRDGVETVLDDDRLGRVQQLLAPLLARSSSCDQCQVTETVSYGNVTSYGRLDIAIVGSGFSGLGLAVRLQQEGIEDFVVLERGDGVGGTWHYNTYPGCACDVPSHLYSFSFAPNPDWTRTYSRQPEIRAYLERVADGGARQMRLNCEVRGAAVGRRGAALERSRRRTGRSARGCSSPARVRWSSRRSRTSRGSSRFEGPTFHSARWDHARTCAASASASIGTGASAIQYVPAIAPDVSQLYVLQRTPPWVMPHSARPISRSSGGCSGPSRRCSARCAAGSTPRAS